MKTILSTQSTSLPSVMLSVTLLTALTGCVSSIDTKQEQQAESNVVDQAQPKALLEKEPWGNTELTAPEATHIAVVSDEADQAVVVSSGLSSQRSMEAKAKKLSRIKPALFARSVPFTDVNTAYYQDKNREQYASIKQSAVKQVTDHPVSTFSIDVDTGSYTNVRRMLNQGHLPPADAVRIEEMINYFDYGYEAPEKNQDPFSIHTELALSPWSEDHALLRIALKGYEPLQSERPSSNLVFLLDVSGSMNSPDKLPLLKKSLIMLSKQLTASDKVSIVVYAGASGVVLEPTDGNQTFDIEQALEKLSAGGSTNGQAGIQLAYQLAKKSYIPSGINRVILATDGDFNVGTSDVEALKALIERKREEGISLTTLGFGTGNYNDHLMEQLADVGNGNYAYIDSLKEARKVLVEELSSTLMTIAKDVKIQVEFNPSAVKEYRLMGYENRALAREDFNNDKVDAGEVGAGHTVTALYEVVLQHSNGSRVDPLRYQRDQAIEPINSDDMASELAFIKFRYKEVHATTSKLISRTVAMPKQVTAFEGASDDFRFSATVAQFGESLRGSKYIAAVDYDRLIQQASHSKGSDKLGYRSEFVQLVRLASSL